MNQNILANNMNMYIYSPEFDISKKPFIYNWRKGGYMGGRVTRRQRVPPAWHWPLLLDCWPLFECFRQICSQPFHRGLHLPLPPSFF